MARLDKQAGLIIALTFGFIPAAINGAAALLYWRFVRTSLTQASPYERIVHEHV